MTTMRYTLTGADATIPEQITVQGSPRIQQRRLRTYEDEAARTGATLTVEIQDASGKWNQVAS